MPTETSRFLDALALSVDSTYDATLLASFKDSWDDLISIHKQVMSTTRSMTKDDLLNHQDTKEVMESLRNNMSSIFET